MEVDASPDSEEKPPPTKKPVLDSWEDAADGEGTTPEGDDMDPDVEEEQAVRTKKKPTKTEVTRSKKEHVNVVFIGHVGKSDS